MALMSHFYFYYIGEPHKTEIQSISVHSTHIGLSGLSYRAT
jgi:hypothetical protein